MKNLLIKVLLLCGILTSFSATAQHSLKYEEPLQPQHNHSVQPSHCALNDDVLPDSVVQYMKMAPIWAKQRAARKAASDLYICRIAVDIDSDTYEQFNRDTTLIKYEVIRMIEQASKIYETEINTQLVVTVINIWKDSSKDPYKNIFDINALYTNLTNTWFTTNASLRGLSTKYDKLMYINSKGFSGAGGLGSLGGKQSVVGWGNITTIAHELGHNFGSPHTQSCSWVGGIIDYCYASESDCYTGALEEKKGTVMSYCNVRQATFHPLCQAVMNQHAASKFAKVTAFSTNPAVPPLLNFDGTANLIWTPDLNAETYRIELSEKNDFSEVTIADSSFTNTYNFKNLARKKYYARIKSVNRIGSSGWSNTMTFAVSDTALLPPVLALPLNNVTNIPSNASITLSFKAVDGATSYELELTSNSDMSFKSQLKKVVLTTNSYVLESPLANYGYRWRVRAVKGIIKGGWSEVFRFFTRVSSSVTYPNGLSSASDLPLVFPISYNGNAFTSLATVRMTISTKSDYSNPVYVKSVTAKEYNNYYYSFMTSNLNAGTLYYLKIEELIEGENPLLTIPTGVFSAVTSTFKTIAGNPALSQWKYFNNDTDPNFNYGGVSGIFAGDNAVFFQTSAGLQSIHTDSLTIKTYNRTNTAGLLGNNIYSAGEGTIPQTFWGITTVSLRKEYSGNFPVTKYALNHLSQQNGKLADQTYIFPYLGDTLFFQLSTFHMPSNTLFTYSSTGENYALVKRTAESAQKLIQFSKDYTVYVSSISGNEKQVWVRALNKITNLYELWQYDFATSQTKRFTPDNVKEFGVYVGQAYLDSKGILWVISYDNKYKLLKYDGVTWTNVGLTNPLISSPNRIVVGKDGLFYLYDNSRILKFTETGLQVVMTIPYNVDNRFVVDNRGKIWFYDRYNGLIRFDPCTNSMAKPVLTADKSSIDYGQSIAIQTQGCTASSLWTLTTKGSSTDQIVPVKSVNEFSPLSTTQYTVRCVSESNCLSEPTTLTISVLPTITLSKELAKPICQGDTITLSPKLAGDFDATNKWSFYLKTGNSKTAIAFNTDNKTFSIPVSTTTGNGQYYLKMEASQPAVQSKDSVLVNVQKIPSLTTKDFEICENQNLMLSVVSDASTYEWSNTSGSFKSSLISPVINTINTSYTGNYRVTVTGQNGCKSLGNFIVKVNPLPKPVASLSGAMYAGTEARLYATGASSYSWTGPNGFSSKEQSVTIGRLSVADEGLYTLKGTDLFGCIGETSVTLKLQLALGNETEENTSLLVFPNPTSDVLRIRTNLEGVATVKLIDALGREVLGHTFRKETAISTSEYAKGVYFVEVEQQGFKEVRKIIIH